MKLAQLGEQAFIERLKKKIRYDRSVVCGIGDDSAVVQPRSGMQLVMTSDMLIEGVHFTRAKVPAPMIGRKALAVSISDIAAMAATPRWALVSVGLPPGLPVDYAESLHKGLRAIAKEYKVALVGGDTVSSEKIIIDVALIGEAAPGQVVRRDGAKKNDVICVTGSLGGSLKKKHYAFTPRVKEAAFIRRWGKPTSMIDISDGLALDVSRIMTASKVGAELQATHIPLGRHARSVKHALYDGEDFELLFTVPLKHLKRLCDKAKQQHIPITPIGTITPQGKGLCLIDAEGKRRTLTPKGYEHFV